MNVNRLSTQPIKTVRSNRNHALTVLTSLPPGKMVPIAAVPLLREDSATGRTRIAVEMHETVEMLMNPVFCTVSAYFVPHLALERFEGSMDQFNRSYMGQKKTDDPSAVVVPFIETHAYGTHGSNAVYKALGLHANPTDQVNTAILEGYNLIWNMRATNRSKEIAKRTRLQSDLAPAFWTRGRFDHIVPDFDQAVIDGEIALNYVQDRLNVQGLYGRKSGTPSPMNQSTLNQYKGTDGDVPLATDGDHYLLGGAVTNGYMLSAEVAADIPQVFVEMEGAGISISLSNLELAKKTATFAKLQAAYEGYDEEYIIDMLMNGLHIPDQSLKQPILIGQKSTRFTQAKRYATDSGNLAESVVSGIAAVDLNLRVPRVHTGGVIIIVAEAVPEQLFERQADPYFHTTSVDEFPEYLRDTLDPEKVEVVYNKDIDTSHATPNGVFGYQPLNAAWTTFGPKVGGKFFRPTVDTSIDEERQRIWAVEAANPVLAENFYIVSSIHQKVFYDTSAEPFDAVAVGNVVINGNTVFGGVLHEATANYEAVLEKAPTERITK